MRTMSPAALTKASSFWQPGYSWTWPFNVCIEAKTNGQSGRGTSATVRLDQETYGSAEGPAVPAVAIRTSVPGREAACPRSGPVEGTNQRGASGRFPPRQRSDGSDSSELLSPHQVAHDQDDG